MDSKGTPFVEIQGVETGDLQRWWLKGTVTSSVRSKDDWTRVLGRGVPRGPSVIR